MWNRCRTIVIMSLTAVLAIALGCSGTLHSQGGTALEKHWGSSLKEAKTNQTLNPEAAKNLEPVVGLDGRAGERVIQGYENSFQTEAQDIIHPFDKGSEGVTVK